MHPTQSVAGARAAHAGSDRNRALCARLPTLAPLLARLNDCKRIRTARDPARSLAGRRFARAWAALAADPRPEATAAIAVRDAAAALVSVELAGVDAHALRRGGLADADIADVLSRAIAHAGRALAPGWRARLVGAVPALLAEPESLRHTLPFVRPLQDQPRAGATHPREARLVLEPPESHADHAWAVAVTAVLIAGDAGGADADLASAFLAGLGHHLHNAELPDAGFAGEELLGAHLAPLVARLTDEALAALPAPLAASVRASFGLLRAPDSPAAAAFHAADVIDRVLEVVHFDRVARFRKEHALDTLGLVHPGPLQAFQDRVLAAAGLVPR